MDLLKTNMPGLVKDSRSHAVINTDIGKYYDMLNEREKNNQIMTIKNDVDGIKIELKKMKVLLDEVSSIIKR